jgi:hypothetical protein
VVAALTVAVADQTAVPAVSSDAAAVAVAAVGEGCCYNSESRMAAGDLPLFSNERVVFWSLEDEYPSPCAVSRLRAAVEEGMARAWPCRRGGSKKASNSQAVADISTCLPELTPKLKVSI